MINFYFLNAFLIGGPKPVCGICGSLLFDREALFSDALLKQMADAISHRGPDDDGYYISGPVGLGFRRLSVIDLELGHQPLSNEDCSIWIVFNGEIYNYRELRGFLLSRGHVFKTQTDTEVIVHLYEELGTGCLDRLRGMFSFAIWDSKVQTLLLARDRIGIKPLYYHLSNKSLVFASEIKAILADPSIGRQIDPALIDRFLTFLYLPGEGTLLKGIQKLAPGHYLLAKDGQVAIRQYWDLRFEDPPEKKTIKETEANLVRLLAETVDLHMIADVPVGVLLSGGVDSTGLLSLAVESTDKIISTFTVGFSEKEVADERPFAKLAAARFGTRHYETTITANDFVSFLPRYVWYMEEPVCEPPAIALYYVSKLAKEHVTVLLSGEGGDEAFAGYSNYRNVVWFERMKRCGPVLSRVLAGGMSVANSVFDISRSAKYAALINERFPGYYWSRTSHPYCNVGDTFGIYSESYGRSVHRECSVKPVRDLETQARSQSNLNAMLYIDSKTWLPDDLLIKADKMTMANSIELRVPLLDHKVLEFAASLPASYKLSGVNTKYILKRALSKNIPSEILNRKKTGFPVPYGSWLRNDLKDVARDVLMDSKTINRGYFRKDAVEKLLQVNASGADYSKEIFSLLILEIWQRTFLEKDQVVL